MATNPYINGISVPGTGPSGSASNWATSYDQNGNLVANTGFGYAPIYTADQFNQWQSSGKSPFPSLTAPGMTSDGRSLVTGLSSMLGTGAPIDPAQPGGSYNIQTKGGGTQAIDYTLDPKTGYYIPNAARGLSPDNGSWFDSLIKYGAMAGTALAGGAGALGYGSAGPGAEALGGSAGGLGAAGSDVAPEIANFTPSAINAPGSVSDVLANNPVNIAASSGAGAAGTGGLSSISPYLNAAGKIGNLSSGLNMVTGGKNPVLGAIGALGNIGGGLGGLTSGNPWSMLQGGLGAIGGGLGLANIIKGGGGFNPYTGTLSRPGSPPQAQSSGTQNTSLPAGFGATSASAAGAPPSTPSNTWSNFSSKMPPAQNEWTNPNMAKLLGINPGDIGLRSFGTAAPLPGGGQRFMGPPQTMADGGTVTDPIQAFDQLATMFGSGRYNTSKGAIGDATPFWQRLRSGVMRGNGPMGGNQGFAEGGQDPHVVGGLSGSSGGQDDNVPARLSHGEYVIDADVVSALGDGNNNAGANKLDKFREAVRSHKRGAPSDKIPPKAKDLGYYMPKKR